MRNIFFNPRVGEDYENKGFNGIKLLILGESHYCDDKRIKCEICGIQSNNDCSNFTKGVLNRYFNYKKGKVKHEDWMRTFTRFTNVLLGNQVDNKTLIEFWDSVIFYNYVQSSTDGPRTSPTNLQFIESQAAFISILEENKPDLILVWGKRLWENLPNIGRWGDEDILDNANGHFYYYKVNNNEIPAYRIYHPSTSYFNYEYSKYLKEAIRIVSKSK
ncbi:MAG: hypothetical protein HXX18_02040 [Bacteroidetes bacterium]|nr:hypothetical protein [Bacteroidota bacterium]